MLVLLADSSLAALPLEALPVFSNETVHAVTRDFSLQMLCNRLKKFTVDEGNWGDISPRLHDSGNHHKPGWGSVGSYSQ